MKTQNGSLSRLQPVLEQWTVLGPGERDNWAFQRENFYSTHRKVWSPCCRCTDTFSLSCSSPRKTNKWNKAGQTKLNCSQILIKHPHHHNEQLTRYFLPLTISGSCSGSQFEAEKERIGNLLWQISWLTVFSIVRRLDSRHWHPIR